MRNQIGFMQGRLSPIRGKKIQSFPWKTWKSEFKLGNNLNLKILEWTLDYHKLYSNPLMTDVGQKEIKRLCSKHNFKIVSLTGDLFMQKPFWKSNYKKRIKLQEDFLNIINRCGNIGIKFIVLPLVDNGKIINKKQEMILITFLKKIYHILDANKVKILFEADFRPKKYIKFIKNFNKNFFGINYDIGNSASYNFNPSEEITLYGKYICNVHVKDRVNKGSTVFLGEGNADFATVFKNLKKINYKGNFILQGARSKNNQHVLLVKKYKDFVMKFLTNS